MTSGARQSLLLVDADPQSLRVLDVSLKKAGYDVLTAAGGSEALAILAETSIDLVISDTHMPEMDGFELCRRIKERADWSRIPFIFLSSRKTIEDKIRGLEIGVEDYLIKPVYIKEITTRVRMLLQRRERERLESRRETRTRFAGELSDIGIVDLVQTIEVNRKSGIVHIGNADGRRGAIYFRDGRVIDAEAGRLAGLEAAYRLFAWNDGSFEVEFKNIRRRDVIELSSQALLMEGMRRLDEWTRLLETLPPLETVFEVDYQVLAERLADIPDEVNAILRLLDGRRSLLQVIEDSDFPDVEAASVLGRLHADRVIYEAQGDKPAHLEPRQQPRMGRLERWLSESPWASGEQTPAPVKPNVDASTSDERTTLTGFSHSGDQAPSTPGRSVSTMQGMAIAADELPDVKSVPIGRTLHGFSPVRPLIDPDKTPSPGNLGAQPSQEMQAPGEAGPSDESIPEPVTSRNQLGEEALRALLGPSQSDDRTPAMTLQNQSRELTSEAEEFPDTPSAPGGTVLMASPTPTPPPPEASLGEPPEPSVRRSGSARREGLDEPFVDEPPPSHRGKVVALFLMAVAVSGVVTSVAMRSHKMPATPSVAVRAPVEAPRSEPAVPANLSAPLPAVDLPLAEPKVEKPLEKAPVVASAAKSAPVGEEAVAEAMMACKKAYASQKFKAIMDACGRALEANPKDPTTMVRLAHAELDRGHSPAALRWAKKAIAADPKAADAYVFVGEVEQELGNKSAAKAAYQKYLELSPTGKFASDLRSIVKNL